MPKEPQDRVKPGWTARAASQLRRKEVWVAAVLVILGVALAVVIAAKTVIDGGATGRNVARLGLAVPLLVACVLAAVVALGSRRAWASPRVLVPGVAVAAVFGSLVVPLLALGSRAWAAMLPLVDPAGADFRAGLYDPAEAFSVADSGWPPLTLLLGRVFTIFSWARGYRLQILVLVILGLATVLLSVELGRSATWLSDKSRRSLLAASAVWLLASYGFLFEVETGNINVYALFFALLAVWAVLRFPKSAWPAAFLLAVAINLKMYPAILLVVVFWRYRWRAVLPVVASNAALFLAAGFGNAWTFCSSLVDMQVNSGVWLGNHSARSFAETLHVTYPWIPQSVEYVLLVVPIALWSVTALMLLRRGWSRRGAVLLAAASVPLMNSLPAVSMDYKLVLMVFPLAVLGALLLEPGASRLGSPIWRSLLLGLMGLEMAGLTVPTKFWGIELQNYPHTGIGNKYPLVLFMQLLLLTAVMLLRREDDPEYRGAVTSDET